MKTLEVQLPDLLRHQLEEMARLEGISFNQMLIAAVSNEVVRKETQSFFHQVSHLHNPKYFAEALAAVPDVPPVNGD